MPEIIPWIGKAQVSLVLEQVSSFRVQAFISDLFVRVNSFMACIFDLSLLFGLIGT